MRSPLALRVALLSLVLLGVPGCGDDDGTGPDNSEVQLTSGVAVANLSGAEDSERHFRITVPTGAITLEVTTSGGTGDVDIFVRHGERPTPDFFDCDSTGDTNAESCLIDVPDDGTWYITLYGFEAYNGVTLRATVSAGP